MDCVPKFGKMPVGFQRLTDPLSSVQTQGSFHMDIYKLRTALAGRSTVVQGVHSQ